MPRPAKQHGWIVVFCRTRPEAAFVRGGVREMPRRWTPASRYRVPDGVDASGLDSTALIALTDRLR